MKVKLHIFLLMGFILLPSIALADGKFFSRDIYPPDIPYQRAVLSYKNGEEFLIVQSKFQGEAKDFGWVVPLPNVPNIGTIPEGKERSFFLLLGRKTAPVVRHYGNVIAMVALGLCVFFLFLLIVAGSLEVFYAVRGLPKPVYLKTRLYWKLFLVSALLFLTMAVSTPNLLSSRGVDILYDKQIGIYDVKVIKSSDSKDLIAWLNQNEYKFTSSDESAFNSYIKKDWCFVTCRINRESITTIDLEERSGLPDPLVLVFESSEMVYPLILTGTTGRETEVVLYVFGEHKMETDERFKMEFADQSEIGLAMLPVHSENTLGINQFPDSYLTKFRGKLSPEQMKQDLIIKQAEDDDAFRLHIWKW